MADMTNEEKLERRRINESVIGTNAMEGLRLDSTTLALMRRYEEGELTREELSGLMDAHGELLLAEIRSRSRASIEAVIAA